MSGAIVKPVVQAGAKAGAPTAGTVIPKLSDYSKTFGEGVGIYSRTAQEAYQINLKSGNFAGTSMRPGELLELTDETVELSTLDKAAFDREMLDGNWSGIPEIRGEYDRAGSYTVSGVTELERLSYLAEKYPDMQVPVRMANWGTMGGLNQSSVLPSQMVYKGNQTRAFPDLHGMPYNPRAEIEPRDFIANSEYFMRTPVRDNEFPTFFKALMTPEFNAPYHTEEFTRYMYSTMTDVEIEGMEILDSATAWRVGRDTVTDESLNTTRRHFQIQQHHSNVRDTEFFGSLDPVLQEELRAGVKSGKIVGDDVFGGSGELPFLVSRYDYNSAIDPNTGQLAAKSLPIETGRHFGTTATADYFNPNTRFPDRDKEQAGSLRKWLAEDWDAPIATKQEFINRVATIIDDTILPTKVEGSFVSYNYKDLERQLRGLVEEFEIPNEGMMNTLVLDPVVKQELSNFSTLERGYLQDPRPLHVLDIGYFSPQNVARSMLGRPEFAKYEMELYDFIRNPKYENKRMDSYEEGTKRVWDIIHDAGYNMISYPNAREPHGAEGVPSFIIPNTEWSPYVPLVSKEVMDGRPTISAGNYITGVAGGVGLGSMIYTEQEAQANEFRRQVRSVRNNNPGNIKDLGIDWKGETGKTDSGGTLASGSFEIFSTPEYGVRALTRDLKTKRKRGLTTIRQILEVYAPNGRENDTNAYIRSVSRSVGIGADAPLKDEHMFKLIKGIIKHEGGKEAVKYYDDTIIRTGMEMAK